MKRILPILSLLLSVSAGLSHGQGSVREQANMSPRTRQYLSHPGQILQEGYVYKRDANGVLYISALVKAGPSVDVKTIAQLGAKVGTRAGSVWTVQIPPADVQAFAAISGIDYLQLDEPVSPLLDSVRKVTRADSVQAGIGLPRHFSGKNVVMGIIDIGFDYSHPLFYDTLGNAYRIRKVWEQKTAGTPPAGYSYGSELSSSSAMLAAGTDNNGQSHGTHVAGIAAGSGIGSSTGDDRFRGLAFGTDVVLVGITPPPGQWMNTGLSDIIDGMKYIFDYAAAAGKPAVVNLSWGCSIGSHDGLSLFSQACDALTGPGKLFVCSAGNTGTNNLHLQKTFAAADTIIRTFVTFSTNLAAKKTWLDVWGDSSKTFCLSATLFSNNVSGNSTGFICLDNSTHNTYLVGAAGDTCFIDITTATADVNGKPRILLNIYNKAADALYVSVKASSGKINMWEGFVENSSGYYGALTTGGQTWAAVGDNNMTISDISSTRSAIAVGAYAARNSFVNSSGATQNYSGYPRGRLVSFSSHGPTANNETSPHIAAPGLIVASGINSYDASFSAGGSNFVDVFSTFQRNGRTYSYAMLSGTSMSSPVVSGIVALLLEANPRLTPQQVKDVLAETAITDVYTGALPAAGNNTWGHGKVNAYGAIRKVLQDLSVNNTIGSSLTWSLYPNPNKGAYLLDCTAARPGTATVELCDLAGKVIRRYEWQLAAGRNTFSMNTGSLAPGLYVTRLSTEAGSAAIRTLIEP